LPSNSCVNRPNTTAVAREQLCGHVSAETREHAIMEETFSLRSVPGLHNDDVAVLRSGKLVAEAGNISGTQR
jgi:hypothetical protein